MCAKSPTRSPLRYARPGGAFSEYRATEMLLMLSDVPITGFNVHLGQ